MIPLISTLCKGPAQVGQLPRLWWKVHLHDTGIIDDEYPRFTNVLDLHLLETLKLNKDETLAFLSNEKPDYLTFEDYVREKCGGSFHGPTIERWNNALEGRTHVPPAKIAETYPDIGFDENVTIASAVLLNCLQDWQLFHTKYLKPARLKGPVVPLISSIDQGRLGICQLPRTWLKVSLGSLGVLHPDYPACGDGLDAKVLAALAVDRDEAVEFLTRRRPSYLEFEDWILEKNGGRTDRESIDQFNRALLNREHGKEKQQSILKTIDRRENWTGGVLLNHLEDWKLAHQILVTS